jgi:hypothetical protein
VAVGLRRAVMLVFPVVIVHVGGSDPQVCCIDRTIFGGGKFLAGVFGAGLSCLPREPLRSVNPPPTEPLQQLPKGKTIRDTGAIELAHAMIRCI